MAREHVPGPQELQRVQAHQERQVGEGLDVTVVPEPFLDDHVANPRASAASVPGRMTMTSSALLAVAWYSQAMTTLRRRSAWCR